MVQFQTWLLKGLLGLVWVLPVWMSSGLPDFCKPLEAMRDQLNSSLRRRYMRQYFPINYTVQVQYEEIFRLRNISRLIKVEGLPVKDLQNLWITVTQSGINKILNVLPDRHPTRRKYLSGLKTLIEDVEKYHSLRSSEEEEEEQEQSASITDIFERLRENQGWKSVSPKFLLDNCYRTMHCLFKEDCFVKDGEHYDYCSIHHWRNVSRTG